MYRYVDDICFSDNITTARLIEDIVIILNEQGARDITLVEGVVEKEKESDSLLQLVVKGMGLDTYVQLSSDQFIQNTDIVGT